MALAVAGSTATGVTELSYPYAYRDLLPGVRRPHEHDRDPDRRHPAAAEFAGRSDIAGVACVGSVSPTGELILDHVERHARRVQTAIAVYEFSTDGGARTPRADLGASSMRQPTAPRRALLELGVTPGDAVAYQLPNRLEFVTISLATLRIGAVCEPLMPIFRERELDFMLRQSAARVLIVPDSFRGHDHRAMARALQGDAAATSST